MFSGRLHQTWLRLKALIYRVMLKSLPVTNPSELYRLGGTSCCVLDGLQGNFGIFLLVRSISSCRPTLPNSPRWPHAAAA
jgi:hypothetical protein